MADLELRYTRTRDGVSIAFSVMGEGVPVVYASNVMGDVHWYAHNEATRSQIDALVTAGCRVIRYDLRGMGSSDREACDFSVQSRVLDLEAVVDQEEIDRFALCGYAHGSPTAITYAAEHPDRVSQLVLVNPYATGSSYYEKVAPAGAMIELRATAERDWEFYTLTLASAMAAHDDPEAARRTAALFRMAVTPDVYFAFAESARATAVADRLGELEMPTLVLLDPSPNTHPDLAKGVAAGIRGARLATTTDYVRDLLAFLGIDVRSSGKSATAPRSTTIQATAIIFFVDIADSTALTERVGDAVFREASRTLDEGLRGAISACGGTTIDAKTLGDGVLATFPSAAQAIDAARRCVTASASAELPLHIGIHAGDVLREEGNVFGGAVNIASRICGLSAPGEVLVSATVRELARTSAGVAFEDRGERQMKGVGEPVRVYAVRSGS